MLANENGSQLRRGWFVLVAVRRTGHYGSALSGSEDYLTATKGSHVVMPALATLSLAVLAEKSGVDTDTIRSYGRLGLISRSRRAPNGLQLYPADEVERVTFIRRSLELGFSVQSIREMLGLGRGKSASCSDIYAIAERQLSDIRRRLADLSRMEGALASLVDSCPREEGLGNCTIVRALSQPSPLASDM